MLEEYEKGLTFVLTSLKSLKYLNKHFSNFVFKSIFWDCSSWSIKSFIQKYFSCMAGIGTNTWLPVSARVLERLSRQEMSQEFYKMLTALRKRKFWKKFVKLQTHMFFSLESRLYDHKGCLPFRFVFYHRSKSFSRKF